MLTLHWRKHLLNSKINKFAKPPFGEILSGNKHKKQRELVRRRRKEF